MAVTYDRNSFSIEGQRVFLTSGSIHYFRVPRALWRDRLEKAKAAGLNTIQFYVAWNWHEPEPGRFDFSGERDLDHFMTLAEELGLYLVARPGPYICAEWEFGGFPAWLMQIAGIQLRRYDPIYLRYVDRYLEQVLPLIARHQVGAPGRGGQRGGVMMVQAENELGLVTKEDGALYMRHLVALYRRLGITVPINTCEGGAEGTIECVNSHTPSTRFADYRRLQPDAPLHCTEFWSGWYSTWDRAVEQHPRSPAEVERETWRILAYGGAGFNFYMWHGGTNFGYTTMYLNTTSYDYTAPLSEAGGIWEKYRRCRRVSLFAQTFAAILTEARPGNFVGIERDTTLGANFYERVSPHGSILFVENPTEERLGIYLYINGVSQDLFVNAQAVRPVVYDVPLGGHATLALCSAGVLGRWTEDNTTLLVVYGDSGLTYRGVVAIQIPERHEPPVSGELIAAWSELEPQEEMHAPDLEVEALLDAEELGEPLEAILPRPASVHSGGMLTFTIAFTETPQTAEFTSEGHRYRLLALPSELADRTWHREPADGIPPLLIGGQEAQFPQNQAARLGLNEGDRRIWRYTGGTLTPLSPPADQPLPAPPALTDWGWHDGEIESAPDYDDSAAIGMFAPTNRVHLDAQPGYAWYRTAFDSPVERDAALTLTAFADRVLVFLNGRFVGDTFPPAEERVVDPSLTLSVRLQAGRNVLAILTDNLGHVKGEWQFRNRPMAQDKKGLFGDVVLDHSRKLTHWRFLPGLTAERVPHVLPPCSDVTFQVGGMIHTEDWEWKPASDVPQGRRLRWYRAAFRLSAEERAFPGRELSLDLNGMGKGVLWVNGINLGRYWTLNGHTRCYAPKCWMRAENTLILFEEADRAPSEVRFLWEDRARIASWLNILNGIGCHEK